MVPTGIAGVAYDLGGRNVLEPILTEAGQRGHEVYRVFPEKRGVFELQREVLGRCQVLLIGGPSSNYPEEEIERARLFKNANPDGKVFVVEDSHGTSWRAKDIAHSTDGAIVALPAGLEPARASGYPNVEHLGVPSHWQRSYDEVREGFGLRDVPKTKGGYRGGIGGDDRVITVSGGKSLPGVFNDVLERVCSDGRELLGDHLVIAVDSHPREELTEQEQTRRLYLTKNTWVIPRDSKRKGAHLIGYADATIFAGAVGPTGSVAGAMARMPMAYFQDEYVERELVKQVGVPCWWVARLGAMHIVRSIGDVRDALEKLLHTEGEDVLLSAQKRHFPVPKNWGDFPRKVLEYVEGKFS